MTESELEEIEKISKNQIKRIEKEKDNDIKSSDVNTQSEENTMNTMFKKDFGPVPPTKVSIDYTGNLVIKSNSGEYYKRYDKDSKKIINIFDNVITTKFPVAFLAPVLRKDLKEGDIIKYNGNFLFVVYVDNDGDIVKTISFTSSISENLVPESLYGLDIEYHSKLFSIINPGDKINPLVLLLLMDEDKDQKFYSMLFFAMSQMNNDNNMNNLLPLMMLSENKSDMKAFALMLMMMQNDNKKE